MILLLTPPLLEWKATTFDPIYCHTVQQLGSCLKLSEKNT